MDFNYIMKWILDYFKPLDDTAIIVGHCVASIICYDGRKIGNIKKSQGIFWKYGPNPDFTSIKTSEIRAFRSVSGGRVPKFSSSMVNKVTKIYFKTSEIRAFDSISDGQISKFSSRKIFFIGVTQGKCVSTMIEASVVWTPIVDPNSVLWIEITQPTQLLVH